MANNISTEEIANRIIETILADNILSPAELKEKITSLLKIWTKFNDRPINYENIKSDKGKLLRTIESRDIQLNYWKSKFREKVGKENMQIYYNDIDELMIKHGYK